MTSTKSAALDSGAWTMMGGGESGGGGGGLSRVDEDEIFLFDEDFKLPQQTGSPVALVMHDLEFMTLEDDIVDSRKKKLDDDEFDEEDVTLLSVSKTENNFLRQRRFHFYSHSPGDVASSADSELSTSITIEGLRNHLQSCFTCGVLWRENQASLDCHECDGYALTRPCTDCNGKCTAIFSRDLTTSHQTHKAKWVGVCKLILNCSIGTASY